MHDKARPTDHFLAPPAPFITVPEETSFVDGIVTDIATEHEAEAEAEATRGPPQSRWVICRIPIKLRYLPIKPASLD